MKQQKFSTRPGQILSLILYFVWSYYLVSELFDLSERSSPRVVFSEYQPANTQPQILSKSNFTFAITVTDSKLNSLTTLGQYFNLIAENCKRSRSLTENGTVSIDYKCTNIPLEPCTMENHFISQYQKEYFKKFNLKNMYCPESKFWDENQIQLIGYSQEDQFQFLTIYLTVCKNSTQSQNCSSPEEISENLLPGFYVLYLGDSLLKMSSNGLPYENSISVQYSDFSLTNSKSIHSSLKVTETTTDYGVILTDTVQDVSLSQNNIKEETSNYNKQYLVANSIFLEQRRNQYQRSYIKLYTLLGQIGGLWQLVNLILNVLLYPILFSQMNLSLANKIFQFENESQLNNDIISVAKSIPIFSSGELRNRDNQQYPSTIAIADFSKTQTMIKQFLKKKKSSLTFGLLDSIKLQFGCLKQRERQLQYAMKKIQNKLDIEQLIAKMSEIDKLKSIILNKDQLALFNYIPKPTIPLDMFEDNFDKKIKLLEQRNDYKFILENEKPDLVKLEDAFEAYTRLQKKMETSWIDEQILSSIDDDIKRFFSGIYVNQTDFICQNLQQSQMMTQKLNTERMEIHDEPHIQLVAGSIMTRQY